MTGSGAWLACNTSPHARGPHRVFRVLIRIPRQPPVIPAADLRNLCNKPHCRQKNARPPAVGTTPALRWCAQPGWNSHTDTRWRSTRPTLPLPAALLARRRPRAYVLHRAAKPRKTAQNRGLRAPLGTKPAQPERHGGGQHGQGCHFRPLFWREVGPGRTSCIMPQNRAKPHKTAGCERRQAPSPHSRSARWKSTRPRRPVPAALLARRRLRAYVLHHAAKPRKTAQNRAA